MKEELEIRRKIGCVLSFESVGDLVVPEHKSIWSRMKAAIENELDLLNLSKIGAKSKKEKFEKWTTGEFNSSDEIVYYYYHDSYHASFSNVHVEQLTNCGILLPKRIVSLFEDCDESHFHDIFLPYFCDNESLKAMCKTKPTQLKDYISTFIEKHKSHDALPSWNMEQDDWCLRLLVNKNILQTF